ncbi:MAG: MerR family transcriptional regulator [Pseudomonadota bacterium]|nr:MerR family transcriptional regulator [Pseudomonadota bacterium]
MLIGEASKQTGLSTKTIRFYCDQDLIAPRRDPFTGYRSFTEKDLVKLRFLKKARQLDFSIKDCSELLILYEQPDRASLDVKIIASKKLKELDRKANELNSLRNQLKVLVERCSGDHQPDCPILEALADQ